MEKYLQLFLPQPGYKILDVTSHTDVLSAALLQRLVPVNGRFALAEYPGDHTALPSCDGVIVQQQRIPDYDKPFRALPRDNDVVFLRDVLHRHTQPERLLRAVYTTLANAAEVVIVTERGNADVAGQLAMLEKADFRAANVIEGIDEAVTVVMGKKMHMWGNGL